MLGFPLGILSAAGAGGPAFESDYELIATEVLGSAQSSIVFSSLDTYASDYKHLQIRYVARSTHAGEEFFLVRLNGNTGSNYARHALRGDGSTVTSSAASSATGAMGLSLPFSTSTANAFAGGVIDFLDCFSSTKNTTIRGLSGVASSLNRIELRSGLFINTASVTSITLLGLSADNLSANSRFSLYGIKG